MNRVRELRENIGVTQEAFAELCEVSPKTVRNWERKLEPSPNTMLKVHTGITRFYESTHTEEQRRRREMLEAQVPEGWPNLKCTRPGHEDVPLVLGISMTDDGVLRPYCYLCLRFIELSQTAPTHGMRKVAQTGKITA